MMERVPPSGVPWDALAAALRRDGNVRWAYLFGSAARGEDFADLDVAVMLVGSAKGARALGGVIAALEASAEGLSVDVVDLSSAAPGILGPIVREGRLLLDREPDARVAWEIESNRIALDIEPWLREYARLRQKALLERISERGR